MTLAVASFLFAVGLLPVLLLARVARWAAVRMHTAIADLLEGVDQ